MYATPYPPHPQFKTLHCRHFDEHGNPVRPYCPKGPRCRYIHPEDPNWNGSKVSDRSRRGYPPHGKDDILGLHRRNDSYPRSHYPRPRSRSRSPRGFTRARSYAPPLRIPGDYSPRQKVEPDTEPHVDLHRIERGRPASEGCVGTDDVGKNMGPPPGRHDHRGSSHTAAPERRNLLSRISDHERQPRTDYHRRSEFQSNQANARSAPVVSDKSGSETNRLLPTFNDKSGRSGGPVAGQASQGQKASAANALQGSERTGKLVELFRRLAQCSNKVAQDIAAHDRDENKLQTYKNLSSALASISPVGSTAVAPTLADVVNNHVLSQVQVDSSLNALSELWDEIFDVFANEIAHVIDAKLEDALTKLNTDCERAATGLMRSSPNGQKRKQPNGASPTRSFSVNDPRESMADAGSSLDTEDRERKRRRGSDMTGTEFSLEDILNTIKVKMDKQTRSLETLNRENMQLRATLHNQAPSTSGHSPHAPSILQRLSVEPNSTAHVPTRSPGT